MNDRGVNIHGNDEISFEDISVKLNVWISYLKLHWWKIIIAGFIGGGLGYTYAYLKPKKFVAKLTFLVEEGKTGGGLASLAGQFGFDVGNTGGSSLLTGENLLLFLKSPGLVKEVLLSSFDSTQKYSLADKYVEIYSLKKKWATNKLVSNNINFPPALKIHSRLQDSLLQGVVNGIILKELVAERPEKKATFVTVQTTMLDESLSKLFCERLVNKATERYIVSKTIRQKTNVDRLQRRSDSIAALLNYKTYSTAVENEKALDVNPAYRSTTIMVEVMGRDKSMIASIYAEVVKNLEIAKIQLNQETPTIQVVDGIDLPLRISRTSKLQFLVVGAFISMAIVIGILTIKKYK